MLTLEEALTRITDAFGPLPAESTPIHAALGRFVAGAVPAPLDLPPFDQSAMDGYAVRAADLVEATPEGPIALPVVAEIAAGTRTTAPLAPATCARIFTGAPVPAGADAVVMQEDVTRDGAVALFRAPARSGRHVRLRGSDVRRGSELLGPSTQVGPGEIGILAAQGLGAVDVHRRPRVAVLTTGAELRALEAPAEPGSIVDSNRYALAAHIERAGATPVVFPATADDAGAIAARLEEAVAQADVVLTVGGVSVGDHDLVHAALAQVGIAVEIWKVAVKPGKPLTFARRGPVPIVGLPGNPVSASIGFEVFVRPGLARMLGNPAPFPVPWNVRLAADHEHTPGRLELARASVTSVDGEFVASLHGTQHSGSLRSLVGAHALVALAGDRASFTRGERLKAIPFAPPPGRTQVEPLICPKNTA